MTEISITGTLFMYYYIPNRNILKQNEIKLSGQQKLTFLGSLKSKNMFWASFKRLSIIDQLRKVGGKQEGAWDMLLLFSSKTA